MRPCRYDGTALAGSRRRSKNKTKKGDVGVYARKVQLPRRCSRRRPLFPRSLSPCRARVDTSALAGPPVDRPRPRRAQGNDGRRRLPRLRASKQPPAMLPSLPDTRAHVWAHTLGPPLLASRRGTSSTRGISEGLDGPRHLPAGWTSSTPRVWQENRTKDVTEKCPSM